jgi:hypothetical protein
MHPFYFLYGCWGDKDRNTLLYLTFFGSNASFCPSSSKIGSLGNAETLEATVGYKAGLKHEKQKRTAEILAESGYYCLNIFLCLNIS